MKKLLLTIILTIAFPLSAYGFTLKGIEDQSPDDRCNTPDEIGIICILIDTGDTRTSLDGKGRVTPGSAVITMEGVIQNFSEEVKSFTVESTLPYGTEANPLPATGVIFAKLDAVLKSNDPEFPTATGFEIARVTTNASTFSPNTVFALDNVFEDTVLFSDGIKLEDSSIVPGKLLSNDGLLTVTYDVTLGPKQIIGFNNTFEGGFKIPEPTSTLSLLALGTLGAGSNLLRKKKHKSVIGVETAIGEKTTLDVVRFVPDEIG